MIKEKPNKRKKETYGEMKMLVYSFICCVVVIGALALCFLSLA